MSLSAEALEKRTAPVHPLPVSAMALWVSVLVPPSFWFAQLLWNYGATALACYPAESPHSDPLYGWTKATTFAVDGLAILAAVASCFVAYRSWRIARRPPEPRQALNVFAGRAQFMAEWGLIFSGGFLAAIIFETIADFLVPPCGFA